MQNNIALPYGKQLWYKPHPVHEWHLSNDLLLFSAHQINQGWIVWVNNIIAIPHGKGTVHAQISGYYSSKQFFTGGQTVRQWLTGQSFQEQFGFGMDLLKQYGTVTPTDNGWIFTPF